VVSEFVFGLCVCVDLSLCRRMCLACPSVCSLICFPSSFSLGLSFVVFCLCYFMLCKSLCLSLSLEMCCICARQDRTRQTGYDHTGPGQAEQDKSSQDQTGLDRAGQDKTRDRMGHRTGLDHTTEKLILSQTETNDFVTNRNK
jgi:hypothetical protein